MAEMVYRKYVYSASQRACGEFPRAGPDKYTEVWYVPVGVNPPAISRKDSLEKRGIVSIYLGEWYSAHFGPRSKGGIILEEAGAMPEYIITDDPEKIESMARGESGERRMVDVVRG